MGYDTNLHLELLRPEWGPPRTWTPDQTAAAEHTLEAMAEAGLTEYPELFQDDWIQTRGIAYDDSYGGFLPLSLLFPEWVIQLDGEGEDHGDEWRAYIFQGRHAEHSAPPWTPPPFTPADLRPPLCACGRGPILQGNGSPDCCAECEALADDVDGCTCGPDFNPDCSAYRLACRQ